MVAKDELLLRVGDTNIIGQLIHDGADLLNWRERSLDQGLWMDVKLVARLQTMMIDSFVPESRKSRTSGAGLLI